MIDLTEEKAKQIIAKYSNTPIERKKLVKKCIDSLKLPTEILQDKQPGKELNRIKCLFGNSITELLNSGILLQNNDNTLQYHNKSTNNVIENIKYDIEIKNKIYELLLKSSYTRKEILKELVSIFSPQISEQLIKNAAGQLLHSAIENHSIIKKEGLYSLCADKEKPKTQSDDEENKRLFYEFSDEVLVDKSLLMLESWYKYKGYSNIVSKNTDGPQDGGIDGIIKLTDGLGYEEKIIIQVKNIHNKKHVPLCEIKEFCGVLAAEQDATKGLFITNTNYHLETKKFAKKFKNKYFVLIDGEKWLELAKECKYKISDK